MQVSNSKPASAFLKRRFMKEKNGAKICKSESPKGRGIQSDDHGGRSECAGPETGYL